ncbi:MAG TPA: hypothetical protein PLS39_08025 [Accumulibacter sp.]|nr:hypothetical protein [Accumulibacter sp.]HND80363.1 hypothetical protein [Accumulibacter sp.]HNL15301.1 hypothetical protein [Accumulibacter sp.]
MPRVPDGKPDPFRQQIANEIRQILSRDASVRLVNSLRIMLSQTAIPPGADLADSLCAGDPEQTIDELLFPATRNALQALDAKQAEFADTWRAGKALLAWLSLLAVDSASLGLASRNALSAGELGFEIVVETPLGVELVSSRVRQIAPRLRGQPGTIDVVGEELIAQPPYDTGWGDQAALDALVREVWARVFPEESRALLSPRDLRTLNNELRFRDRHKTFHHYIPVALEQESRLCQPNFYRRLLEKLPAITVIYFKPTGGPSALLVSDEDNFQAIIRNFLTIPEQLAKRP